MWLKKRADLKDMEIHFSIDDVYDMRDSLKEWDSARERMRKRQTGEEDEVVGRKKR